MPAQKEQWKPRCQIRAILTFALIRLINIMNLVDLTRKLHTILIAANVLTDISEIHKQITRNQKWCYIIIS